MDRSKVAPLGVDANSNIPTTSRANLSHAASLTPKRLVTLAHENARVMCTLEEELIKAGEIPHDMSPLFSSPVREDAFEGFETSAYEKTPNFPRLKRTQEIEETMPFNDIPPTTFGRGPCLVDVPSDCTDMIIAGSSVADDVSESDKFETTAISRLSARGFSSGLFFDEEEAGNIERDVFNPESLENALQYQLHLDEGHSTAIESNLDVPKDAAATPQAQVPTIRVWVYDHTFSPRTLLMRRLHHLRQMHVLHELERADAFDATRPLITPALHITPEFHGLCRVAEQGIIGGWTDLDRPEPRFVTHFCGSPARLFKEERAILGEAFQREILTVDELNYREALEVVEV